MDPLIHRQETFNAKAFCRNLWGGIIISTIGAYVLLYMSSGHATMFFDHKPHLNGTSHKPHVTEPLVALSSIIAIQSQTTLQSGIFVIISFFCVLLSTATSSAVATLDPKRVPPDFEEKGTLSNVSQDISSPHGRMFTVALFTASILSLVSMYTTTLYRPWSPNLIETENPFSKVAFSPRVERRFRLAWVIIPNVGFMFTAAIPSKTLTPGADGKALDDAWEIVLTATHNLMAPLSMAFAVVMETVQLSYGESAFSAFWSNDASTDEYGPLSNCQRLRVIVCIYAWLAACVFLGIQTYLGLGSVLGWKIRTSYRLALISFYGEVLGMVFAFLLPALQAGEAMNWEHQEGSIMSEARALLAYMKTNNEL